MSARAMALIALGTSACSFLYDVDELRVDAPDIDAPLIDADPTQLAVDSVAPDTVLEGTGDEGGRPALLIVQGAAIVGDAQVSIAWLDPGDAGGTEPSVVDFDAAFDGASGAVAVRIPVLTDLAAGASRTARLTITQGTASGSVDLTVTGLDELRLDTGTLTTTATPATYSHVDVVGAVHWTGTDPVVVRATAGIAIAAPLDADAVGATAGPHGCDGGPADTPGGCSTAGGSQGGMGDLATAGSGGGGGSFSAVGTQGSGPAPGSGGSVCGNEMLVPIVTAPGVAGNRGNGGGGGGASGLLGNNPGPGGGGGGVVVLQAGGDITVTGTGAVRARGGDGSGPGGAGGGGSGGAILIRSGGTVTSPGPWLSAPGGGTNTAAANRGGAGSAGRIRIDAAAADVDAMANDPRALRGPAWHPATPLISATSPAQLQLLGEPGRSFGVRVRDQALTDVTAGISGSASVTVPLARGRNQVCAVYVPNGNAPMLGRPEALSCVDVVYVGF